jgi:hypothetical protein
MPNLHDFGAWLLGILLYIPQKIFEYLTDALISGIDSIFAVCSVCDFSTLPSNLAALPVATLFILGWFKIGTGLTIISASYVVRFLIRRIPLIG